MKIINKIAFVVHEPNMYAHYSSVWGEMDRCSFTIVLMGVFQDYNKHTHGIKTFLDKIRNKGYETVYIDDVIANNIKYKYVVSNHILGGKSRHLSPWHKTVWRKTKNSIKKVINLFYLFVNFDKTYQLVWLDPVQYPPLQVGIKQIRFMYGADISDAWSLEAWNNIYDMFLCHGPNDEKQIKKRFNGKTVIMGYPKYDEYFFPELNVDDVIDEFSIDAEKRTILWMSTLDIPGDNVCSIIPFARSISELMSDFNIIVRPHPISFRKDPASIELLESLHYKIDREPTRDMNKLFKVADYVFCDHGGSAFGALYLRKKLVLLKTPEYESSKMARGSSNVVLMSYFPSVSVDEIHNLNSIMSDSCSWKSVMERSRSLSAKYFADYRGTSSRRTADILEKLIESDIDN